MMVCEESSVVPKKFINHLLSHRQHNLIVFISVHPPLRRFPVKGIEDSVKVQFRVANLQLNKSKFSTSNQLRLHKVVDTLYILEFVHQFSEVCRLRVPRKQSTINHSQSVAEEIAELLDLSSAILEANNSSSAVLARPKVNTVLFSKLEKDLNSRINTLIFSNNIQKGT
jgi:hypothetical protein